MPVELALTPDSRWVAGPTELICAAAEAGFDAVGLSVAHAEEPAAARALPAAGLRCCELLALLVSRNAEKTLASAERLAAAADAVRAPWVLTVVAAPPSAESVALLRRCADVVGEAGARLAIEFSPLGAVPTIGSAAELVRAADPGRAAVLIDTWHFFRGASTFEELATIPLEEIGYIQFDDALPTAPDADGMAETMDRRTWPGSGTFALERFATTLLDRDWTGTVAVEVLNAELARLPVAEFARTAFETTARYWR